MGIDVSKIGSTLVDQFVGFSSEKIYPNNFLSAKAVGEGPFGRNTNDGYGASIAISENYAVVGVPNQSYDYQGENLETGAGAVYVYERDANTWVYMQKLSAPESSRATSDSFGFAVGVEGNTIVVGAPGTSTNKGAAFVYQYTTKGFTNTGTLIPTGTNAVGTADKFGSSVAVNNGMIVVGAPQQGYDNSGTNLATAAGSAWVFAYDDMSLSWNQVQKIAEEGDVRTAGDELGYSMASTSSYLVVGAPHHPYVNSGENYLVGAGAAYIWAWDVVGNTWSFNQKITPSLRRANANFGATVAISSTTVVVGATGYIDGTSMMGSASVFQLSNNKWVETSFLQPTLRSDLLDANYTYAPGLDVGFATTISVNGNTIAVGSPQMPLSRNGTKATSGIVSVYTFDTTWKLLQNIPNPHFRTELQTTTDNFGSNVSLGSNLLVVGFPNDGYDETDANLVTSAGSVYLYEFNGTTWTESQKIVGWGRDRNAGDLAGASIWYQDGFAFVGAPGHCYDSNDTNFMTGAGAVFVWQWSGSSWTYSQKITSSNRHPNDAFGSVIAGDTGIVVVGAPGASYDVSNTNSISNAGAVFVLNSTNGAWSVVQEITASVRNVNDGFGSSISVNGTDMIVGMPTNSTTTSGVISSTFTNAGAAEFFKLSDTWVFSSRVYAGDNRTAGDKFGSSVSLNSGAAIVGAPSHSYDSDGLHPLTGAGAAWIYTKNSVTGLWGQTTKITGWGQDRNTSDYMGWSSASDGGTLVVGVPDHAYDVNGRNYISNAGAVLVYIWYNGGWFFQQKIVAQTNRLTNSYFGFSVDISGDTLVVGAPQCGTYGTAYIFNRTYGVWTQSTELPFTPFRSDYSTYFTGSLYSYGASVAIDGNYVVIGFPQGYTQYQVDTNDYRQGSSGAAYAWTLINGTWTQETTMTGYNAQTGLTGADETPAQAFGITVDVKDGIAVIGVPNHDYDDSGANQMTAAGAVYIYRRTPNGSTFVWEFEQKLAGGVNDRYTNDQFGTGASIDGNTIAVAAINHPYDSKGTNFFTNAGAVYIWTFDDSGVLTFQQKLTAEGTHARCANAYFGSTIALQGDMIAISSPGTSYDVNGTASGSNYGAVFVYVRTNGNWAIQQWISPPSLDHNGQLITTTSYPISYFGQSLDMKIYNGVTRLLVGAPGYNYMGQPYTGAAFSYTYDKANYKWNFEHTFVNVYAVTGSYGSSVSLVDDIAVVGCPAATSVPSTNLSYTTNPGAASVYVLKNNKWDILKSLSNPAKDNVTGDTFGYCVAVDGTTMVVGAPNNITDDNGETNSGAGAAYVYNWAGSEWTFSKKLTAPTSYRSNSDQFGKTVSVSGDTIAIGAPNTNFLGSSNTTKIPTNGMINYYPFAGDGSDSLGKGADFTGSMSFEEPRPDGTGSTLVIEDGAIIGPNVKSDTKSLSISFWAKIDGTNIFSQTQSISGNTTKYDFAIRRDNNSGNIAYVWVNENELEDSGGIRTNVVMSNDQWYHIALSIDAENSTYSFYVNNQKFTKTVSWSDLSWLSNNLSRINVVDPNSYYQTSPMNGSMFDLRIYDVALTDSDVTSLYSQYTTSHIANAGAVYVFDKGVAKTKKVPRRQIMSADTTWTVPNTISDSTVKVSMWGGAGGAGHGGNRYQQGASGGFVSLRVPVSAGDTLQGLIGQAGGNAGGAPGVTAGALYKGGQGNSISTGSGGSGGSASALLLNGSTIAIAAGGAGGFVDNSGNYYAPPISVASSTVFTSTTSGQDAHKGTSYSLAGGGGGYRGGVTSLPITTQVSQTVPATSGMSWVDPSITTYRFGNTQAPQITDGTSTIGYDGTAGSVNGATNYNGLVVIEWYETVSYYDYTFTTQLYPTGTNALNASDNFGFSVDISGDIIIAGSPYQYYDANGANSVSNAGAAYVFERSKGTWGQTAKITGDGINGRNTSDYFGYSVGVDDAYIIVGAPQHGYDEYGANLVTNNGAAWVFTKEDGTWTSVAKLLEFGRDKNTGDSLGTSIACDGKVCVVGAPSNSYDDTLNSSETTSYANLNYMANSGSAYIWEWNTSTSTWDFKQKIVASDRFAGEQFGSSVALSESKVLIGSYNTSTTSASSAYMFEKTGTYPTAWKQTHQFANADYINYGRGVAIDNNTVVIAGTVGDRTTIIDGADGSDAIIGTSDFTAECWIYPVSVNTDWPFMGSSGYTYHKGAPTWGIYYSSGSGIVADNGWDQGRYGIPSNSPSHIAWSRSNGVSYIFVNGALSTSFADTKNYTDPGIFIANQNSNYVQSVRLTIGKGLYTTTFVPSLLDRTADTSIFYYSKSYSILDVYDLNEDSWDITASFTGQSNDNEKFGASVALNKQHGMILVGAPNRNTDDTNSNPITGAGAVFSYLRDSSGTWSADQVLVGQGQDSSPGDYIGSVTSADGEVLAIASTVHAYDDQGSNYMAGAGAVWIWRYYGTTPAWHLEQKLVASDRAPGDAFGTSLSISGNTLAVGAPAKSSGAGSVYIFTRPSTTSDGTVNCWKQTIILKPTGTNAVNAGDKFGFSVSLQETTSSLLVGAPYHGYDTTGDNFLSSAGAAWAFSNTSGTWTQTQKLIANGVMNGVPVPNTRNANDYFGYSVGLKDNSSIIGATGHQYDKSGTNPLINAGAAFLFTRTDNAHPWNPVIKFTGDSPERNPSDQYGFSVASTADTIVIGSPNQSYDGNGAYWVNNAGAVYVWVKGSSGWTLQQKLSAQDGSLDGNILREVGDNFGYSVAISGDTLIVGIPNRCTDVTGKTAMTNAGAIMVFKRSNGVWTKYGDMIQGSDTAAGDTFGDVIDFDGKTIAVGVPLHSLDSTGANSLSHAGAVYLFTDSGTAFTQEAKITPTGTNARNANDNFGYSISIKDSLLIVGSPYHSYDDSGQNFTNQAGAAWIFTKSSNIWTQMDKISDFTQRRSTTDAFGSTSYAFSDTYLVVGAPGFSYDFNMRNYASNAGAVYVFTRNGSAFTYMQMLTPIGTNMRNAGDSFGTEVAISGTTIVASSPLCSFDSKGTATAGNTGLLFVFDFNGKQFVQTTVLEETGTNANVKGDEFGYRIAIDGNFIIASSVFHPYDANGANVMTGAGAAWIFYKHPTNGWVPASKLVPSGNNARNVGDNFGYDVDIDGTAMTAVVSSISHTYDAAGLTSVIGSGAAWTFRATKDNPKVWTQVHKLVPTGTEKTSTDNFGSMASYNTAGYLAVSDKSTTDSWYENSIEGTGSVNIFKSSIQRTGVTLDGSSAYMDVSAVAKSITDTTWSISTWMKSTSTPSSSITHNCLYSVKHGDKIMRIYATPDNYIRITYGLTRIDAKISLQSLFDNNWHNLIVSGLGATATSDITVYIDGHAISVTAYTQTFFYPTDYVGFYSMDGIASDSTHTYGDITNATFGDASTLQTNREGISITGSIIPSSEKSFITDKTTSLSFWVNASQATASTGNTALITQLISSDGTVDGTHFLLNVSCNNKGQFFVLYNNSTAVTSSVALVPSTWYNIVVMIDPVNSKLSISVNNTLTTGTLTTTGSSADTPILFGSAGTYTNDTKTGMIPNYSNFVGLITDLKIYNRTLTTDEITYLYKEFVVQPVDNNEATITSDLGYYLTGGNTNGYSGVYTVTIPNYLDPGTGIEFIFYLTTLDTQENLFIEYSRYDDWHLNNPGSGSVTYMSGGGSIPRRDFTVPGLVLGWNKIYAFNDAGTMYLHVNGSVGELSSYVRANTQFSLDFSNSVILQTVALLSANQVVDDYTSSPSVIGYIDFTTPETPTVVGSGISVSFNGTLNRYTALTIPDYFVGKVTNNMTTRVDAGIIPASGDNILVGAGYNKDGSVGELFTGVISDVAVINGPVSADDAKAILTSGKNSSITKGIVGNWLV